MTISQNLSASPTSARPRSTGPDDYVLRLASSQADNLGAEVDARWRLVETAWNLGVSANLLAVQHDPQLDGGPAWEPTMVVWYDCNGFLPVRIESRYPNGQVLDAQLNSSQIISSN